MSQHYAAHSGRHAGAMLNMLKLYHAEPVANSLKTLISLKEKGLALADAPVHYRWP